MAETINLKLKIWRQRNGTDTGNFEMYDMPGVNTHMSFLEMLDVLNDRLFREGKVPVAFDNDCREGICVMCSMYINGRAHG
ncbi:MAG: succinate dehydrogenase/fumarate reductase iron-sulfur subunit, partial [Bacteroidia bacterium]|nr:succinate dehydrogenase/fumarate reductase iron-sulfur subunit [Bacteroidia bacterium]